MKQKRGKADGTCHVCGTHLDAGFCWKCGGDGPPAPKPAPAPPVATHEENMAGLAAMKAVIFGKRGPMAEEMDRVTQRLSGALNKEEKKHGAH